MLPAIAGLTTKVVVGAAAVALTGAGAVATVAAGAPAAASNSVGASSSSQNLVPAPAKLKALSTPPDTSPASTEPGDDNGVDPTPEVTPTPDQATITSDQAVAIALALFPQGTLHGVHLESEHGVLVWKVDLRAADGARAKIWVNANDGTVVRERIKQAKADRPNHGTSHRSHGRGHDDRANAGSNQGSDDSGHHGGASGRDDSRNDDSRQGGSRSGHNG